MASDPLLACASYAPAALLVSSAGIAVAAVLYAIYAGDALAIIMAVASFAELFVWLMIFVTHVAFRRKHRPAAGEFRMIGAPGTTLGGALLIAVMVTSMFTPGFRSMLLYGVPFLGLLTVLYWLSAPKTRPDADLAAQD